MYLGVAGEGGKIWDYAAGSLIVLEAGGYVSDCFLKVGSDRILHSESILASATAELHQEMATTLLKTVIAVSREEGAAGPMSPLGKTLSQMFSAYT
jgi:3'-phosphoadenosine 5'-phosphosulfate (PAPS) 3'-phosphatase